MENTIDQGRASMRPFFVVLALVLCLGLFVLANPLKTEILNVSQIEKSQSLPLMFEDGSNGIVVVRHGQSKQVLQIFEGEASFLRNALRSLTLERQRLNLGIATPFVLHLGEDQRLRLTDPLTHRHIDVAAFGKTNAAPFFELFAQHVKSAKS
jgi:putative photosynthetic complex assembly protein